MDQSKKMHNVKPRGVLLAELLVVLATIGIQASILLTAIQAPSESPRPAQGTGPHAAAPETDRLRVLSYNIHHAEGLDEKLDLERIAGVIRSASPDIVALQEVDQGTSRTNRVDQPAELSRLTKMHVVFGKNIDYEGGSYGNAILSRLPAKLIENVKLPSLPHIDPRDEREQRGALVAELKTASGATILFGCVHLDHRSQDDERFASAQVINEWFERQHKNRPAILAGDLNATTHSRVLKRFQQTWHRTGSEEMATVPAATPRRQIDYIVFRPANRWRVVEVRVLDEPIASDHRPILAVLQLVPSKPK